jgi:hypothetical protein
MRSPKGLNLAARQATVARPLATLLKAGMQGVCLGVGRHAAYVQTPRMVVALTARGVARPPNGICLSDPLIPDALHSGCGLFLFQGGLVSGGSEISWDVKETWDPRVPHADMGEWLTIRVEAIAGVLAGRSSPDSSHLVGGVDALVRAFLTCSPESAGEAARRLVGAGPGLTPEGDDHLAAAALTFRALAVSRGLSLEAMRSWLQALLLPDLGSRTSALSDTLLRCAVRGWALEPLRVILDPHDHRWSRAIEVLRATGHTTGTAYLRGLLLTAGGLSSHSSSVRQPLAASK